jgi:hypothetical protein
MGFVSLNIFVLGDDSIMRPEYTSLAWPLAYMVCVTVTTPSVDMPANIKQMNIRGTEKRLFFLKQKGMKNSKRTVRGIVIFKEIS